MMRASTETALSSDPEPARARLRLLSCIRFDEVLVLQGAPLIGAGFSIGALTWGSLFEAAIFAFGSVCLVAHVFVLNDWSGINGDLRDPNRAKRAFTTKGVSRTEVGYLATSLLVVSLLVFGLLGAAPLVFALAIASLSAFYSAPVFHMKGRPLVSSVLHLVGGKLHFLLGYVTFAAVDLRGFAIGCFFGLVFTAGHLTHEARDCEIDSLNGIQTNAVAFGRVQSFVASLAIFTAAYALLVGLAASGAVSRVLILAAPLYPLHVYASWRAWRAGLSFESLRQLQGRYRLLYAAIGIMMITTTPWLNWRTPDLRAIERTLCVTCH